MWLSNPGSPILKPLNCDLKREFLKPLVRMCFFSWLLPITALSADFPSTSETLTFEKHIRPIFKAQCFECHGEGDQLKGGLDVRLRRFLVRGGETGPAIVSKQPDKSLLMQKVESGEMPKRERKLSSDQIELIRRWIAEGAPTARAEPDTIATGMFITAEEQAHWAFQPILRPPIPKPQQPERVRTAIDAFIEARFPDKNLAFSPEADKVTLIRRAYFDLIGFPPNPEEVANYVNDHSDDAYEKLIDRLLSSPRYGERWARHWLDVAGYADSEGYAEADTPRDYAYKYRDYVIRSLNNDKPFDQFVHEQLAGDELAVETYLDREAAIQSPGAIEKLAATGFLRMGPDGTGSGGVDADAARNQVLADTIRIVSTSLIGLTVGCAQCHDHRYDPIPQTDYYRLRAILEPAYDWTHWRNPSQRLISLYTESDRTLAKAIDDEARTLAEEKGEKEKRSIREALDKHLEKFDAELRDLLKTAFNTSAKDRNPEQTKLLKDHPSVNITPGVLYQYNQKAADELKELDSKIAAIRARKPPEDFIRALTEVPGQIPVTYLFHRGDPKQPKQTVSPGTLSVLSQPDAGSELPLTSNQVPSTGRRLAFARWLTSNANPLLARVWVNRVWMHHFGRGIVGTPADFGLTGEKPTHPELLDWLASAFSARDSIGAEGNTLGWSLKRLHKLIMTSTVYRQASLRSPEKDAIDPENHLYWRKPVQRLDAEAIRDSILTVSGSLNTKLFGVPIPVREDLVGQVVVGIDKKQGDNKMPVDVPMHGEEFRRSVYIQVRRSRPLGFLNSFDAPAMELNCERRQSSTVAPQALMLMNSEFAIDQAQRFAERLFAVRPGADWDRLDLAWKLAFSREPSETEIEQCLSFLSSQVSLFHEEAGSEPSKANVGEKNENVQSRKLSAELQAWTNLCQALMSANEFLYVD